MDMASRIIKPVQQNPDQAVSITAGQENFIVHIPESSLITASMMPAHYLYYHVSDISGHLKRYGVYRIDSGKPVVIGKSGFETGDVFRCSFNGETSVWKESR